MTHITTLNPAAEKPLGFQKLADRLGVHPATILRWTTRGAKGFVLETMLLGNRRVTTEEAYARFVCAINPASSEPRAAQDKTPYSPRKHYSKRLRKELKELGLA